MPVAVTPSGALLEELHASALGAWASARRTRRTLASGPGGVRAEAGFEPVTVVNLEYVDEEDVVAPRRPWSRISHSGRWRPGVEAVFLACTNLPTVPCCRRSLEATSACRCCRRTRCSSKRPSAGWTDRPWAWLRPPSTADRHGGRSAWGRRVSGTDEGAVIGILYPVTPPRTTTPRAAAVGSGRRSTSRSSTRPWASTRTRSTRSGTRVHRSGWRRARDRFGRATPMP